jgi:hypothetical protein
MMVMMQADRAPDVKSLVSHLIPTRNLGLGLDLHRLSSHNGGILWQVTNSMVRHPEALRQTMLHRILQDLEVQARTVNNNQLQAHPPEILVCHSKVSLVLVVP